MCFACHNIVNLKIEFYTCKLTQFLLGSNSFRKTFNILGLVWFMVFNATFNNISVIYPGFFPALLGIAT